MTARLPLITKGKGLGDLPFWDKVPMANSAPGWLDHIRIKFWSRDRALKELRTRILNGELAWVLLLLEKTEYETTATILNARSWKGESTKSLKNVTSIVRELLTRIPKARLPREIDPEAITAAFEDAIRRSLPKPKLKTPGN